jgi:hypothetical protein
VTTASLADLRGRLYEAYASQHAGSGGDGAAALVYRRDIRPLLPPPPAGPVVDLGCGRGELVRLLQADGCDAEGIGVFAGRVPNAINPLGGHIRNGDVTHQTSFTARSIRQLAAAAGFVSVLAPSSPPAAHGLPSAARALTRQVVSACNRIALAARTGTLRGHIVTLNLTFAARKGTRRGND